MDSIFVYRALLSLSCSLENTPPKSVVVVCLDHHPFLKSFRHKRRRRRRRRRTFFFVSKSKSKSKTTPIWYRNQLLQRNIKTRPNLNTELINPS